MNCQSVILKSQDELLSDIRTSLDNGAIKESALLAALKQAVSSWSGRVQVCFCTVMCIPLCGACEVDLPCCNLSDVVKVELRVCGCDDCWHEVRDFEVNCGKLRLHPRYIGGEARLTYFASNPLPSGSELRLARMMRNDEIGTDDEVWLQGRVDNLPPAGYLKICSEWIQYQCWEHAQVPCPEVVDPNLPLLDANSPVVEQDMSALRHPDHLIRVECAPGGIHTKLKTVQRRCNESAGGTYEAGTVVQLGFAAHSAQAFDALNFAVLTNVYRSMMSSCRSDKDRQVAFDMMRWYSQELEKAWRSFVPARSPKMKVPSFPLPNGCGTPVGRLVRTVW